MKRASFLARRGQYFCFQCRVPGRLEPIGRSPIRLRLLTSSGSDARPFARMLATTAEVGFRMSSIDGQEPGDPRDQLITDLREQVALLTSRLHSAEEINKQQRRIHEAAMKTAEVKHVFQILERDQLMSDR